MSCGCNDCYNILPKTENLIKKYAKARIQTIEIYAEEPITIRHQNFLSLEQYYQLFKKNIRREILSAIKNGNDPKEKNKKKKKEEKKGEEKKEEEESEEVVQDYLKDKFLNRYIESTFIPNDNFVPEFIIVTKAKELVLFMQNPLNSPILIQKGEYLGKLILNESISIRTKTKKYKDHSMTLASMCLNDDNAVRWEYYISIAKGLIFYYDGSYKLYDFSTEE